jgi:hypothetical protein
VSVIPIVSIDSEDPRAVALALAVMHHGLSNLAEGSIPSRTGTVMDTAADFERYLNGEDRQARPPTNSAGPRPSNRG